MELSVSGLPVLTPLCFFSQSSNMCMFGNVMSSKFFITANESRIEQNSLFWRSVAEEHLFSSVRLRQKSMKGVRDSSTFPSSSMERLKGMRLLRLLL